MFGVQRHIIQIPAAIVKRTATLQTTLTTSVDFTPPDYISARYNNSVEWHAGVTDTGGLTTLTAGGYRELPAGSYTFRLTGTFVATNEFSDGLMQLRANYVESPESAGTQIWSQVVAGPSQAFDSGVRSYTSATAFTISAVIYASNSYGTLEKPGLIGPTTLVITEV